MKIRFVPNLLAVTLIALGATTLLLMLFQIARAADGSGTMAVSPGSVQIGSTGNTLTFTFTASETMDSGEMTLATPTGWSALQGTSGTAGYTTVSSASGMVANVIDTMNSLGNWQKGPDCGNIALSIATLHEGSGSIECVNLAQGLNKALQYNKLPTPVDWSTYTKIGFWINSSLAIAGGDLSFALASSNNLGTGLQTTSIGSTIPANTWTYITVNISGLTRSSILSYGLFQSQADAAINHANIFLDDILAGPGSPTFSSGVLDLRILQLGSGQTMTVTYGVGGGTSGATAPGTAQTSTFTTQTRSSDSGTLTNLATSPAVSVQAAPTSPPTSNGSLLRQSTANFSGKAFPGAHITLFEKLYEQNFVLQQGIPVEDTGNFRLWAIPTGYHAYGIIAKDAAGRSSAPKLFNRQYINDTFAIADILLSPTIAPEPSTVTLGAPIAITGAAYPGSRVTVELDSSKTFETTADTTGGYDLKIDTAGLALGSHSVRATQTLSGGQTSDFSLTGIFSVSNVAVVKADFNNDGIIDIKDWSIFLANWNTQDAQARKLIDLNGDGKIDITDLSIFLNAFKK